MELVADLSRVIALYTTFQGTFELLAVGRVVALFLYQKYLWLTKARVESRDLMVDPNLVERAGWFAYYLICNRTFYGYRYIGTRQGPLVTFVGRSGGEILEQYPDKRVRLWSYSYWDMGIFQREFALNRKVVYIAYQVMITEDGNLQVLGSDKLLHPKRTVRDAVEAVFVRHFLFILTRDGKVFVEDLLSGAKVSIKVALPSDQIIGLVLDSGETYLRNRAGELLEIDLNASPVVVADIDRRLTLTDNVTPDLERVDGKNRSDVKVIKSLSVGPRFGYDLSLLVDINRALISLRDRDGAICQVEHPNTVQMAVRLGTGQIVLVVDP